MRRAARRCRDHRRAASPGARPRRGQPVVRGADARHASGRRCRSGRHPTDHRCAARGAPRPASDGRAKRGRTASIEGRVFRRSAVATLLPQRAPTGVDENLLHLIRQELIDSTAAQFAGERAFSFGYVLICDAAYRAAPKRRRATQHELFAGWLQDKAADRLGEFEELLAHHLARAVTLARDLDVQDEHTAELAERAAHHYRRVADRALSRRDSRAGTDALAQVATLLPAGDPRVPVVVALHALAAAQVLLRSRRRPKGSWADPSDPAGPTGSTTFRRGSQKRSAIGSAAHALRSVRSIRPASTSARGCVARPPNSPRDAHRRVRLWLLAAMFVFLLIRPQTPTTILISDSAALGSRAPLEDESHPLRRSGCRGGWIRSAQSLPRQASTATFGCVSAAYVTSLCSIRGDEAAARCSSMNRAHSAWKGLQMMLLSQLDADRLRAARQAGRCHRLYPRALEDLEQGRDRSSRPLSAEDSQAALTQRRDYQAALEEAARARILTGPGDIASKISWRAAEAHALLIWETSTL